MMGRSLKNIILQGLYAAYDEWAACFPFACRQGCSTCCTRSVTMTTLEGGPIMDYLADSGRLARFAEELAACRPLAHPLQTTNQFAASCLAGEEADDEQEGVWDLNPCLFLTADLCTIYPVRPFGCRSFASIRNCRENGSAEVDSLLLTVNAMMLQIIEHLDSDGGLFGNMTEVLRALHHGAAAGNRLLPAEPNPGFLVPPEETTEAAEFLGRASRMMIDGTTLGRLLADRGAYGNRH